MTAGPVRVVFSPSGRQGEVPAGASVLDAARRLGADLDSICGGRGICGRCQVRQGSSATIPGEPDRLSPPGPTETEYRGRRPLGAGMRLACATSVLADVVIDVPPESQVHRQVIRKRPEVPDIEVDPVVRLYFVDVPVPDLEMALGDDRRLLGALAEQWELTGLRIDSRALGALQRALTEGAGQVTVAVHDGCDVTDIWPGLVDRALGIAFDVGSTTIAGHLCDLMSGEILATAGEMNPQIRFGEDVMSRVSYAMLNEGGGAELTGAVQGTIDEMIGALVDDAGVDRSDVFELVLVGNPIMHHLFLGLDAIPLGTAPFNLATDRAVRIEAADLGLRVHPRGRVYVPPCIAGHVGADTSAALLSEDPAAGSNIQLLVDVGTNAEIVLGNAERLLAASSPTGPAFEGAQISSGQRAAPGAIERVRIDRETLAPRIKIVGGSAWSDEPLFAEEIGRTPVTGICGSGIIEVMAELFLAGVIDADGVIRGDLQNERIVADGRTFSYVLWPGDSPILITQADVRAVQLAKAALYAGVRLLMDHYGTGTVDEIRLAGAFGNHIDPVYAMVLGMIPDCPLDAVSGAGNAAGTGAMIALLSGAARRRVEAMVEGVKKIETATEERFQEHFVDALAIPHKTAEHPYLAAVITLPERPRAAARTRRSRRRGDD